MKKAGFKIRRKIILAFIFCFLSVLLFAIFSFESQREIGRRLRLVEVADDLVNNLLEVRRFEKNFFLYKQPASLHEALIHVDRVEALYLRHEPAILNLSKDKKEPVFYQTLLCYKETLSELQANISKENRPIEQMDFSTPEESLRIIAQSLLDVAATWAKEERDRIDHLFRRALYLFIAALAFFVIIGIAVAFYISRLFTTPLVRMQQAMEKIAMGDFTPIPEDQRHSEEFAPLFKAFNRMINELEERQEQLVQARKISAIGTFTSGIAHELNNPVNNIVLTAEALKEDFGSIEEQEALGMIQDIITQSERASEIIRNLLDFSRSEKPEMISTSISSVIGDTLKLVRNQLLLSGVEQTVDLAADLPNVCGDYKSLQQVFLNLFINSIQAMPHGGNLIVKGIVLDAGQSVRISITDSGEGIDPEDLHHIFDPFFTTKEVGKGTGLGLSVTYGILQKHGGAIEAHSQKGEGATFLVTLPTEKKKTLSV
ncbi:MAG: HAMP domain-containing sensor histidine kinase [Syntrophaceae bacterium]|nr:HAMP domain-containing sensor histidine kinase [Syntrophaceae bacterium]